VVRHMPPTSVGSKSVAPWRSPAGFVVVTQPNLGCYEIRKTAAMGYTSCVLLPAILAKSD
jgi:hypothetical protein